MKGRKETGGGGGRWNERREIKNEGTNERQPDMCFLCYVFMSWADFKEIKTFKYKWSFAKMLAQNTEIFHFVQGTLNTIKKYWHEHNRSD
jgi:hypothetical protein